MRFLLTETPRSTNQGIVHALDVGWGRVKHTQRLNDGTIGYHAFQSLAIPADTSALRTMGGDRQHDTVCVPSTITPGARYEVGPEISSLQTGNEFGRVLSADYYRSAVYEALMLGALRYCGDSHIDMLVVGLPVSLFLADAAREYLVKTWSTVGKKPLDLGDGKTLTINNVLVLAQPQGGFLESFNHLPLINQCIANNLGDMTELADAAALSELNILVLDPGYNTLDWLTVNGGRVMSKASGAAEDAGRNRVLRAVAEALTADRGKQVSPSQYLLLDKHLREGTPVKLEGRMWDLSKYRGAINAAINDPLNRMIEGLRGTVDNLDLIIVAGGHPELYCEWMAERMPYVPIVVLPDSPMANVRGFYDLGVAQLEDLSLAEAVDA